MQVASEPDEAAGEFEEAEVVRGLLLVADEQAATLGEPGQRPFDDPPACLVPRGAWRSLVVDRGDVRDVVAVDAGGPAGRVVVALVEAEVLGEVGLGLGTYTRRPLSTAFLVLGSFGALLVLSATGEVFGRGGDDLRPGSGPAAGTRPGGPAQPASHCRK